MKISNKTKIWITALLDEIKLNDPQQGSYIERHLIFDDRNEIMIYTGDTKIIEFILKKSTIEDIMSPLDTFNCPIESLPLVQSAL